MIDIDHATAVWLAKAVGLIYLMLFFAVSAVYAFWPSNGRTFDRASQSALEGEDGPARATGGGDG